MPKAHKKLNKTSHGVCFALASYCCAWDLLWRVVVTQRNSTAENCFSLCRCLSMANSFMVKVEAHVYFSLPVLATPSGSNLIGLLHAGLDSVSSYAHQSSCVWKSLLLCSHPQPSALTVFLSPSPHRPLGPEGRGFDEGMPLYGSLTCKLVLTVLYTA